jgi:UDP-4-amino-4,6-dideoxy-N-acetyl-beta-L-altrosamine transaminase
MSQIPYARQLISDRDIEAVVDVLRKDYLTQGPALPAFECAVAEKVSARHATAVNSATSALHIALLALGVCPGDRVWTTPVTFVATSNAALYCGATVDFVDIDPATINLDVIALEGKLQVARAAGELPKVVIPVHFGGSPCDMRAISRLAVEYGFRVVEDASHAIGATYEGEATGNCRYSDITVFSFHPVKIITSAEGGMALTNDAGLDQQMKMLRSHGITGDPSLMEVVGTDLVFNYQQITLGFNYRMTELQAALGLSQLAQLDDFVAARNQMAADYLREFANLPVQCQYIPKSNYSAYHLFVVRLTGCDDRRHRAVYDYMHAHGVTVNLHYIPVYLQPYYRRLGFESGYCPQAEAYYREALTLPLFPGLVRGDWERVVSVFRSALKACA